MATKKKPYSMFIGPEDPVKAPVERQTASERKEAKEAEALGKKIAAREAAKDAIKEESMQRLIHQQRMIGHNPPLLPSTPPPPQSCLPITHVVLGVCLGCHQRQSNMPKQKRERRNTNRKKRMMVYKCVL